MNTTIPKRQRIVIYKKAIHYINIDKRCNSGLCYLFNSIAQDLHYISENASRSQYYCLINYPEMPRDYINASTDGIYHDMDIGFATREGKEKRLNLLKQIINKLENEKDNNKTFKVSKN